MLSEGELMDILRSGLWTALLLSLPILSVTLVVGVVIGLIQALTSVQEMTLTFVPKLGAILVVFWATMGSSAALIVELYRSSIIPVIAGG